MIDFVGRCSRGVVAGIAIVLCPGVAFAAPQYAPVEFESDFEGERPERTKRLRPALEQAAQDALKHRHGVEVVTSSATNVTIYVRDLRESPKASTMAISTYAVKVKVTVQGKVVVNEPFYCSKMGEAELVDCAVKGIVPVLAFLPLKPDSEPVVVKPTKRVEPTKPIKPIKPIGPWGIGGIVVAVAGVATLSAGGVYLARNDKRGGGWGQGDATSYRPRGLVLVGVGAAALVAGAVAIGVDVGLRAKRRKNQGTNSAGLAFGLWADGPGLSVRGRF